MSVLVVLGLEGVGIGAISMILRRTNHFAGLIARIDVAKV